MKQRLIAASLLLSGTGLSEGVSAQMALEEVVVTAQKRQESLQDTPISLVAMGTEQLENLGITEIADLGSNIPNLQVSPHPNSPTTPRVFVRGVGNFDDQITQDPSVAVYIDGVYVGRNQGMGMEVADIERIEVLRGPQGTLYGRNATGGAINFISRAPDLEQWGGSQKVTLGRRDEYRSRTMLNIPIGEDLAARVFYLASGKDGFVGNAGRGTDTYGAQDHDAQRVDLLYQPGEVFEARYAFDRSSMKDSPFYLAPTSHGVQPERPSTSHAGDQFIRRGDVATSGHQLTLTWELSPSMTLRSISAYRDLDSYVFQDYLSGTGRPFTPLTIDSFVDQSQFSQELQLLGTTLDYRLEYTFGLYYFEEEGEGITLSNLAGFGIQQYARADVDNSAVAVFGQGTYTPDVLDDRLHLTLGLRWSEDQRKADLARYNRLLASGMILSPENGTGDKSFDDLSPSLTIEYDVTDTATGYAKVTNGYKTGGFNMRASDIAFFEQGFDEESLRSFEVGLKSQWLGNRVRANLAVFKADYNDIQVSAQTNPDRPTVADILNAGEATIEGLEMELTALVSEGLLVAVQYGYLNADYDQIREGENDITEDYAFVNTPQHSYTVDVTYDVARTSIGLLIANLNYTWQDDKFISASRLQGDYKIEDYGLLNARLALEDIPGLPAGHLKVALWGRNLEDKEYAFLNAPGFGSYRAWGEPRSYGVDISWEF